MTSARPVRRRLQRYGAALGAALALGACGEAPRPAPPPVAAIAGERLTIHRAPVDDYKPVAATVTTRNMSEARARIGGTLVRLAVKEGDEVRRGDVIGVVADQRLTYETSAFGAQAAATAAQAERAQADLGRVRTLYDKGIYAKARLDQAEADARAARGLAAAARAQQSASAEAGAQGAVLAPAAGRILKAETPAGSVVTAGQSIATITAGEPLLRVEIPEAQARALRVGDAVAVDPRDLPGAASSGVVRQLYPAVTAGRVTADIAVPGLSAGLVGQRVRVRIKVGERLAITLPRRLVSTRYGIDYVQVLDRSGRTTDVAVQLAPGPDPAHAEVLSGLGDGDVVLVPRAAS